MHKSHLWIQRNARHLRFFHVTDCTNSNGCIPRVLADAFCGLRTASTIGTPNVRVASHTCAVMPQQCRMTTRSHHNSLLLNRISCAPPLPCHFSFPDRSLARSPRKSVSICIYLHRNLFRLATHSHINIQVRCRIYVHTARPSSFPFFTALLISLLFLSSPSSRSSHTCPNFLSCPTPLQPYTRRP